MKKILSFFFLLILLAGGYAAWMLFGPTVSAPEGKYFYVHDGESFSEVKTALADEHILQTGFIFDKVAAQLKYPANVKPGRYEIHNNGSMVAVLRMLRNGSQSAANLVINKLRTKEDLAGKIGKNFEADSSQVISFLLSNDSLARFGLDTNNVMTAVIPDTYSLLWNTSFEKIFGRLKANEEKFWTPERIKKAATENLDTQQAYTLASIVEEETTKPADKGLIASVYINRLARGQNLAADPTVKYALRNFGLKRVLEGHLKFESPYNTYKNKGLPPGPICTPSAKTIDAVLDAPRTNFLYFVAKPELNGYSNFSENFAQHLVFAKAYQKALDSIFLAKQKRS